MPLWKIFDSGHAHCLGSISCQYHELPVDDSVASFSLSKMVMFFGRRTCTQPIVRITSAHSHSEPNIGQPWPLETHQPKAHPMHRENAKNIRKQHPTSPSPFSSQDELKKSQEALNSMMTGSHSLIIPSSADGRIRFLVLEFLTDPDDLFLPNMTSWPTQRI